jgi:hypothetical protein
MIERFPVIHKKRRASALVASLVLSTGAISCSAQHETREPTPHPAPNIPTNVEVVKVSTDDVLRSLGSLAIKGRAPKTGYSRDQFGNNWTEVGQCDTRDRILRRDLTQIVVDDKCEVQSGKLQDPYTNVSIDFIQGSKAADHSVDIDHVVSLSDAWQKGAQGFTPQRRVQFANDGLNLLATKASVNRSKGDGDFATWKPGTKTAQCNLAARQILVKDRYELWVTQAEHDDMTRALNTCPDQVFSLPQ